MRAGSIAAAAIGCLAALWGGLAVVAPILQWLGQRNMAHAIYTVQHLGCGQTPSHSIWVCGNPMGLCARHTALYTALGVAVFLEPLRRLRIARYGLTGAMAALVPMMIDVGLTHASAWHSTMLTRLLTGTVAGLGMGWYLATTVVPASY